MLSFQDIEAADKSADNFMTIEVKGWGGEVQLRKLGAAAYVKVAEKLEAVPKDGNGNPTLTDAAVDLFVSLLSLSIVDAAGNLMFREADKREFLRNQPFELLLDLANAALDLNGFSEDGKKKDPPPS